MVRNRIGYFEIGLLFLSVLIVMCMSVKIVPASVAVTAHFWLYTVILLADYSSRKSFNLYQVWIAGFIFIILSEMVIIVADEPFALSSYRSSFAYLLLANDALLLGYHVKKSDKMTVRCTHLCSFKRTGLFYTFIAVLYVIYLVAAVPYVASNMLLGRQLSAVKGSGSLLDVLVSGVEMALPAIIGYHFKYVLNKKMLSSLILVLPVFILTLLSGTRFRLLFSLIPYFVVVGLIEIKTFSMRKNMILLVSLLLLMNISSFVKWNRDSPLREISMQNVGKQINRTGGYINSSLP